VGELEALALVLAPDESFRFGLNSWSLKDLQTQEDVETHPLLAKGLQDAMRSMRIYKAYAPNVAPASAEITSTCLLQEINLGDGRFLYRNHDIPADGIFLRKGAAFMMSSAGCPVIIATAHDQMAIAHAGRDSLIDRDAVLTGEPMRIFFGAVYSLTATFAGKNISPEAITMSMHFALPAESFEHSFEHPLHGEYNRRLAELLEEQWPSAIARKNHKGILLDLGSLFKEQALNAGVSEAKVMDSLAELPYLTHTRDGRDPSGERKLRNLIVVKRTL
jgi:hypothetical protein